LDFDWKHGELAEGLACFRRGDFFLAHEHWETVWLQLKEPEKSFLQALIQMSSACHHRQRGNLRGAISLMQKSLRRLEMCPPRFAGIEVAALCREVRAWLRPPGVGVSSGPQTSPKIVIVE
jgi:predicted metal-dependent hydrolase